MRLNLKNYLFDFLPSTGKLKLEITNKYFIDVNPKHDEKRF